jgi:SAM-dependent methyltransferase
LDYDPKDSEKIDLLRQINDDWNDTWYLNKIIKEGGVGLEIGCGTGRCLWDWVERVSEAYFIDISEKSVPRALESLQTLNLRWRGCGAIADTEQLPFPDDFFDFVWIWGVLHHTPQPANAVTEIWRVLKRGGKVGIGVYNRNLFFNPLIFPLARAMMKLFSVELPGRYDMASIKDPESFIRAYDGVDNPIGLAKTREEWLQVFAGLRLVECTSIPYPTRFFPRWVGPIVYKLQRRFFSLANGIYFVLEKSNKG